MNSGERHPAEHRPFGRQLVWVPFAIVVGLVLLTNAGVRVAGSANAASTSVDATYSPVPKAPETICTTDANGTQTCPVIVGVIEYGSLSMAGAPPAGTYFGTIDFVAS